MQSQNNQSSQELLMELIDNMGDMSVEDFQIIVAVNKGTGVDREYLNKALRFAINGKNEPNLIEFR